MPHFINTRRLEPIFTMDAVNSTSSGFTSVLASTKFASAGLPPQVDYFVDKVASASIWTVLITLFAMCVVYDQSMSLPS